MAFSNHVKVLFGADTKDFQKGLSNAQKMTNKFADVFKNKFVGLLGAAAIASTTKRIIEFGASIGDVSDRLGIGAEFLQKFQYAASQNGVATSEASIALQRFTRRVSEARAKSGPLRDTMERLGISLNDTKGNAKSSEEIFQEFGKALAKMSDPADKLRTAFQFLDTEGAKLTQLFREGAPTIAEYGKEAEKLGLIVKDDQVKALQDASGALEEMGRSFQSFIATGAKPLTAIIKGASAILRGFTGFIKENAVAVGIASSATLLWVTRLKLLQGALGVVGLVKGLGIATGISARSMKLFGIALKALAVGKLTVALKGLVLGFKALNLAVLLNPFGILLAGLTAILAPFVMLKVRANEATEALRRGAIEAEKRYAESLKKVQAEIQSTAEKIRTLQKELNQLRGKEPIEISFEMQVDKLKLVTRQLDIQEKQSRRRLRDLAEEEQLQLELLKFRKEQGREAFEIRQTENKLAEIQRNKAVAVTKVLEAQIAQKKNAEEINKIEQKIVDRDAIRAEGLEDVLKNRDEETLAIKRQTELLKLAKEGNNELMEKAKQRHAWEDKILALMKDGNLTFEQAKKLATERMQVDNALVVAEGKIAEKIKDQQNAKKGVNNEAVRALELAEAERQRHLANQQIFDDQLRVMQLRAQGMDKQADALEEQLDLRRQAKDIAEQLGVAEQEALDILKKKEALEININLQKLRQEANAKKQGALEEMAQKKIGDAIDQNERKRIRASKDVLRLDEKIAELQKQGGARAQREIDKLQQVKERKLEIALDDKTKDDLKQLEKKALDLKDNHAKQMAGLEAERKRLDLKKQEIAKQGDEAEQKVKVQADKEEQRIKEVHEANKKEIVEAGNKAKMAIEKVAENIANIKIPEIKIPPISPPVVNNQVVVNIESELKESTQQNILGAVRGKFVNQ